MVAAATAEKKPLRKLPDAVKPITWKDFQRRYLRREDGYKYEWVRGMVEKSPRSIKQEQYFIFRGEQMTICTGDDLCSAAPALPDFVLTAAEVFRKPPKPEGI